METSHRTPATSSKSAYHLTCTLLTGDHEERTERCAGAQAEVRSLLDTAIEAEEALQQLEGLQVDKLRPLLDS
jgi:hypothetical protein